MALAHAAARGVAWRPQLDGLTEDRQNWLAERPLMRDLSLCHGELGIAEVLAATGCETARRRHAGLILDAIDRYGPCCGTPDGVPTPGLLTGLAGIGYGLLRLGYPERVPSALLLEPVGGDREK